MEKYISDLINTISNCKFTNSYKMAWIKGIVEICNCHNIDGDLTIDFHDIAKCFYRYYFDQTIYFNLYQSSSLTTIPLAISSVKKVIEQYYKNSEDKKAIRWIKLEDKLNDFDIADLYKKAVKEIEKILSKDVSWRFIELPYNSDSEAKKHSDYSDKLYHLDLKNKKVILTKEQVLIIQKYSDFLFPIINYRWTQMLERFNRCPNIANKVKVSNESEDIRRKNLKSFHNFLDMENRDRICFYCDKVIDDIDLSVDHVIPWSYMYSDDIWNLVYCHRSCNSKKSAQAATDIQISKLTKRNSVLLNELSFSKFKTNKKYEELRLAIDKDYVRRYWNDSKS